MRIRAKHAQAIRRGITDARLTRYGDADDPYYEIRSALIWGYSEPDLRELALKAFKRTWAHVREERVQKMTTEERAEAKVAFARAHTIFTETRTEKQYRLLREEVGRLRDRVNQLHG